MQRVQVGIIGLVVVLLFVSLANMVLDRVTGGTDPSRSNPEAITTEGEPMLDEPLAELGVTPVAKDDEAPKVIEEPAQNIRQVQPAPTRQ